MVSATLARLAKSEPHAHAPRQVDGLTAEALAAIQAVACQPRQHARRRESPAAAERRGRVDIALCALLSDAGLRRSEAAALTWADISREPDGSGRVTVRRSKTDQTGEGAVVAVTPGAMAALDAMRHGAPDAAAVFGMRADTLARRVKAAARAAGLGSEFSGHSGRVGCARRMTAAGAPTGSGPATGPLEVASDGEPLHARRSGRGRAQVPLTRQVQAALPLAADAPGGQGLHPQAAAGPARARRRPGRLGRRVGNPGRTGR